MATNSTKPKLGDKAAVLKAAREFKRKEKIPLLVHGTMRWARKVDGSLFYYGPVDGSLPDFGAAAALEEYHRVIEDDRAGRSRRPKDDERIRLADAVNEFLSAKAALRDSGELSPRTWSDYHATCSRIIDVLGKTRAVADLDPTDFRKLRSAFAKGRGPVSLANDVRRSRVFFRFCDTEGLIDRPCKFGTGFDLPSPKTLRVARAARGPRIFEGSEIRLLLSKSDAIMQAWILLGLNCGFGQSDLARLPKSAIKGGWLDFARPKTGVARRCPLWRETLAALNAAIAVRPEAADPSGDRLCFLTPDGLPIVRDRLSKKKEKAEKGLTTHIDRVSGQFSALMKACKLNGHRNFYALRHGLETIGGETGDQVAVSAIMGHAPRAGDMSAVYREKIGDDRLQRVVDHVRTWLFSSGDNK